jgi:hypothetical protein
MKKARPVSGPPRQHGPAIRVAYGRLETGPLGKARAWARCCVALRTMRARAWGALSGEPSESACNDNHTDARVEWHAHGALQPEGSMRTFLCQRMRAEAIARFGRICDKLGHTREQPSWAMRSVGELGAVMACRPRCNVQQGARQCGTTCWNSFKYAILQPKKSGINQSVNRQMDITFPTCQFQLEALQLDISRITKLLPRT